MYISVNYSTEELKILDDIVKSRLPQILCEEILKDETKLRALIRESVRGQLRSTITEILQGKDYRNFLRDKIMEQLKLTQISVEEI